VIEMYFGHTDKTEAPVLYSAGRRPMRKSNFLMGATYGVPFLECNFLAIA